MLLSFASKGFVSNYMYAVSVLVSKYMYALAIKQLRNSSQKIFTQCFKATAPSSSQRRSSCRISVYWCSHGPASWRRSQQPPLPSATEPWAAHHTRRAPGLAGARTRERSRGPGGGGGGGVKVSLVASWLAELGLPYPFCLCLMEVIKWQNCLNSVH